MSDKELQTLDVIKRLDEKTLTRRQASQLLDRSVRQTQRILNRYRKEGVAGLVSKHRGRISNRAFSPAVREYALHLVRTLYGDFGPTLACEKLREQHELSVSVSTLRHWMIEDGQWLQRSQRRSQVHQPRPRRDCFGELIQIDGSLHYWFEGRAPRCVLLVYIDDATGALLELQFTPSESTFSYFDSTRRYLERHGKPVAFYSDKHSVFRVNATGATSGNGMTQFGRALYELNIDIICADTPQAKGRVERVNRTLQDRLVKELRLQDIDNVHDANDYLEDFRIVFNEKFSRDPKSESNVHRALTDDDDLDRIFSWQESRKVTRQLTVQYDRVIYLLDAETERELAGQSVTVHDYPDGTIELRHQGRALSYRVFDKASQIKQADVASSKRLGAALAFAKSEQEKRPPKRSAKAPKRQGQKQIVDKATRVRNVAVNE